MTDKDIFVLSTDAYKAASADAETRFPEESCGFILDDGSFVSTKNRSTDKRNSFVIGAQDWDQFTNRITAIVHSHPDGSQASQADLHAQFSMGLTYVILVFSGNKVGSVLTVG